MIKKILESKDKNLKLTTLGFTLIELLAVIVILAIIALIATPIVLNIIEDSKKSAFKQTGNGIVDAAEYYYMKEMSDGAKPTENKVFTFNGSTTGLEGLEFDGEIPKEGTLTVDVNGKVELVAHNNQYCLTKGYEENEVTIKDYDGNCEISNEESSENTLATICTYDSTNGVAEKTAGAKYRCEVKEGTSYNFYVLTTPEEGAETINLIMDQNIYSDGTPAGMTKVTKNENANKYSLVAWQTSGNNADGPVTAMNYLYNATKDWTNVDPISYEYKDKEYQRQTYDGISYTSFVADKGRLTITPLSGTLITIGTSEYPLRARMPIYSVEWIEDYAGKMSEYGEVADKTENNTYLYENLYQDGINGPNGYWTLSSHARYTDGVWYVCWAGGVEYGRVNTDFNYGVRPVINLKI